MQVCFWHPPFQSPNLLNIRLQLRQIPFAIGQFTVNEFCHELVYRNVTEETKRKISQNRSLQFGISLGSGITAGFAAAILSHVIIAWVFFSFL
jgi:hypothetical protein